MIQSGEARAFSVLSGNQVLGATVDGYTHVKSWTIGEVSVCREGANPDCKFTVIDAKKDVFGGKDAARWEPHKRYEPGEKVEHAGSVYQSKIISKGFEPTDVQFNVGWPRIGR